jgi:hypothetical protein
VDIDISFEYEELKKSTAPIMAALAISTILYTFMPAFYPLFMENHFP